MTSLAETNRHNLATEQLDRDKLELSWNTLAENIRHNIAEEGLKYDDLRETIRNNKVMNKYYLGSLSETSTHNRNVELRDLEELAEAIRHNLAIEKENWRHNVATENEISMHNQAEEWLKQLDAAITAWKANGGKSSSSTGGGGKAGSVIGDIVSNPFVELLKGVAPGLLSTLTGGLAYSISSQQKFNVRDKFNPSAVESYEPQYQKVNMDFKYKDKDEIPTDTSNSYGPGYSNVPIVDVSNKSNNQAIVGKAPYKGGVSEYRSSSASYNNSKVGGSPTGGKSNVIIAPGTNISNSGPGVKPTTNKPVDSLASQNYSPAQAARVAGLGGSTSPTGGDGYSGGGVGGGSR